jgi:hypothetical protein
MAWKKLIKMVIQQGTMTTKEVESIIGRLGHLRMAIPFVHHILSRLHHLQVQAKSRQSIPITKEFQRDLELMINIIKIAHNGISMNIIVYRRLTHIYHSDSCPAGLGDISDSSFAWRYYLKPEHQFRATNNLLEHIVAIITP